MAEQIPSRSDLMAEFEADGQASFLAGRWNNISDVVLSMLSVFGSLAATVLVATKCPISVAASIAAVPAACTSLQRIVNFRGRSHWYFEHASELTALAISLRYASDPNLEAFAEKRANLEVDGEKRWSQLGSDRTTAASRKRKT